MKVHFYLGKRNDQSIQKLWSVHKVYYIIFDAYLLFEAKILNEKLQKCNTFIFKAELWIFFVDFKIIITDTHIECIFCCSQIITLKIPEKNTKWHFKWLLIWKGTLTRLVKISFTRRKGVLSKGTFIVTTVSYKKFAKIVHWFVNVNCLVQEDFISSKYHQ